MGNRWLVLVAFAAESVLLAGHHLWATTTRHRGEEISECAKRSVVLVVTSKTVTLVMVVMMVRVTQAILIMRMGQRMLVMERTREMPLLQVAVKMVRLPSSNKKDCGPRRPLRRGRRFRPGKPWLVRNCGNKGRSNPGSDVTLVLVGLLRCKITMPNKHAQRILDKLRRLSFIEISK